MNRVNYILLWLFGLTPISLRVYFFNVFGPITFLILGRYCFTLGFATPLPVLPLYVAKREQKPNITKSTGKISWKPDIKNCTTTSTIKKIDASKSRTDMHLANGYHVGSEAIEVTTGHVRIFKILKLIPSKKIRHNIYS